VTQTPRDLWQPNDAEYYSATDWLSHSEFKLFRRSPALYEHHVINGVPVKTSAAMEFGSDVDSVVLDPDGFAASVVLIPPAVLAKGGRRAGNKYWQWAAAHADKRKLAPSDPLARVIQAIREHPEAHGIVSALGERQRAFRWQSNVGDDSVKRRAKLDLIPTGLPFLCDLKTSRDVSPAEFAKTIVNLGYHTQAVWYQDAVEAEFGKRPPFLIVAVQNCEPYGCEVYELDATFEALGRKAIDDGLRSFVKCREADKWRPESHGTVVRLSPPKWAEYALNDWALPQEQPA